MHATNMFRRGWPGSGLDIAQIEIWVTDVGRKLAHD